MIARALIAAAAVAMVPAACQRGSRVDSCHDRLDGVWRGDDGRRYHAISERDRVDIYPMFNASRIEGGVDYAPFMFGFSRSGDILVGKRSQRATRRGNTCTIRTDAKIRSCRDNTLVLTYQPMTAIDWARCRVGQAPVVTLTLRR